MSFRKVDALDANQQNATVEEIVEFLHGRLRCPRCGAGALLDQETDRPLIRCLLCAWQFEGASRTEMRLKADLAATPRGPMTRGRARKGGRM